MTKCLVFWIGLSLLFACSDSDFAGENKSQRKLFVKNFQQKDYPRQTVRFTQGHRGDENVEEFEQGEWGPLDLLVVIDNSRSMGQEQANLATKMEPLLSHVDRSDWRINVITTDGGDPCSRAIIAKGDGNAAARFRNAISAGTGGSGNEQGIKRAVDGLECNSPSWIRDESTIAVLIVSDEDNCTVDQNFRGNQCENLPGDDPAYLTDFLASKRRLGVEARVYGIIWKPGDNCPGAAAEGREYMQAITASQGFAESICSDNYTNALQRISEDVAKILKSEFELAHSPVDGTLEILVDGNKWERFELEGRKVRFLEAPPFGSKVEVKYRHGASGDLKSDFDMENKGVPGTFSVVIDGEEFDDFEYDQDGDRIRLGTQPGEKAEIAVTYDEIVPLETRFELGPDVDPATIRVTVDGKKWSSKVEYDSETGYIEFANAPPASSTVNVKYHAK